MASRGAVNHLEAHALTVGLTDRLSPPYLLLLVSGGHTQLLLVDVGQYERLGTTIDDALGEALTKRPSYSGWAFPEACGRTNGTRGQSTSLRLSAQ